MREHLPWLCQGDIFNDVPVVDLVLNDAAEVEVSLPLGPAVLLTHDCAMDKPNRATGEPRAERLQFASLHAIGSLPPEQQRTLRGSRTKLAPFELLYVGDVLYLGECFISLTDPYYLPAAYFTLKFDDYSNNPHAEPGARYVTPHSNDTRLGRLDEMQIDLLRRKMPAFWTRAVPE